MEIFKADIEIICGEFSFLATRLLVCKDTHEAKKIASEQVDKENSIYPGDTFYKLLSIEEFNYLDNYKIDYKLKKI
jgi:hypothetical protein